LFQLGRVWPHAVVEAPGVGAFQRIVVAETVQVIAACVAGGIAVEPGAAVGDVPALAAKNERDDVERVAIVAERNLSI